MCSINHDKKAIFIHIPKTAGMYIRHCLQKKYNFKTYLFQRPDHIEYCKTNLLENDNQLFFGNKIHGVINYYKTSKYLSDLMNMDNEKWDTYYKFCFIRNPYDRIISGWNYINDICKNNNNVNINTLNDFEKYIFLENVSENEYFHIFFPQYKNIINEKNELYINYIGHYENLEEDFKSILLNIGFHEKEIIHNKDAKINRRKHKKFYEIINNQNILNKVNEICNDDFEKLNYKKIDKIDDFLDFFKN